MCACAANTNLRTREEASKSTNDRFIGVDVRPRGFGFIVLEGMAVLDCGSRSCGRSEFAGCLGPRFQRILDTYWPAAIVMRPHRTARDITIEGRRAVANTLRAVARQSGITIVDVRSAAVQNYFRSRNARTKYEIAHAVASLLPELAWKLPPQRKVWQAEHYRMTIFDAAAIALTHIGPQPDPSASTA
jgi:hypothetical protein